jgi:hypothetical protein
MASPLYQRKNVEKIGSSLSSICRKRRDRHFIPVTSKFLELKLKILAPFKAWLKSESVLWRL